MTTTPKKRPPADKPGEFDPSEDRPELDVATYERTEATVAEGRPLAD
jgi:hypothetical protein